MRQHQARAMYDQIEGMLTSITKQLRSTIQADASRVVITLTITKHEVALAVSEDGIGLDDGSIAAGAGGLAGLRARLQNLRGSCELSGARHAGTTVTMGLPISRAP